MRDDDSAPLGVVAPSRGRGRKVFGVGLLRLLFPLMFPGLLLQLWATSAAALPLVPPATENIDGADWEAVDFHFSNGGPDTDCHTFFAWTEIDQVSYTDVFCQTAFDWTGPGSNGVGEDGSAWAMNVFCLNDVEGPYDGMWGALPVGGTLLKDPNDGFVSVKSYFDGGDMTLGGQPPCDPAEVCLQLDGFMDERLESCVDLDLTRPEEEAPLKSCYELEAIHAPTWERISPSAQYGSALVDDKITWRASPSLFYDNTNWAFYVVRRKVSDGTLLFEWPNLSNAPWINESGQLKQSVLFSTYPDAARRYDVIGAGFWDWEMYAPPRPQAGNWLSLPQENAGGLVGVTDPGSCTFYYGEKLAFINNSELDEPAGSINQPDPIASVDPPPEGSDSSDPDPVFNDDEQSWWAQVLLALAAIGAAIYAIPRLILAGLGQVLTDTLSALFVPEDGYWDGKLADLGDAWEATTPYLWLDAFSGLTPGSIDGCGGIPVDVDLAGEPYNIGVHEHIGKACTGKLAAAAQLVKLGMSAVLVIGGGMACVRALGSGLGWAPGIGRGVDT